MPNKLIEARERLAAKQRELAALFAEYPDLDMPDEVVAEIQQRNAELAALRTEYERLASLDALAAQTRADLARWDQPAGPLPVPHGGDAAGGGQRAPAGKSLGTYFVEHPDYQRSRGETHRALALVWPDLELKAVMTLSTGFSQEPRRSGRVEFTPTRRPVVADLIPQSATELNAIRWMQETTFTNAAAAVAEGALKPEAALGYTEQVTPVQKLAVTLPITQEQLDDVPQIRAIIDQRLTLMLQLAEEDQLLNGNGTSPNLRGLLNTPGVQTQAKGTDPVPDALYKAMTRVRTQAFADPTALVMHPNDWQDLRLLRTADGVYIWGSPADPGVERVWGLPVVATTAMPENTALLGDFQLGAHISRRLGLRIDASTEHADYFARNQVLLRAEERLSLEVYRPLAFCLVTGI